MPTEPLELAPFLLTQFYWGMFDSTNKMDKIKTTSGPLSLLTMWAGIYFPSICRCHPFDWEQARLPSTFGLVMMVIFDQAVVALEEVVAYLALPDCIDYWHPCFARDCPYQNFGTVDKVLRSYIPQWLDDIRTTSPKNNIDYWRSILGQRDLPWYGPKSAGVEVYNPNLISAQFRLIETIALPFSETANHP